MKYAEHLEKWKDCKACDLCKTRKRVVLLRGKIPCQVLFIGEAPGESEQALGQPFIGPAGKLADQIIAEAEEKAGVDLKKAFTNVVACWPKVTEEDLASTKEEDIYAGKTRAPTTKEMNSCSSRLLESIKMTKPTLIVTFGEPSRKHLTKLSSQNLVKQRLLHLVHPAFILTRLQKSNQQEFAIRQSIVRLSNVFIQEF